MSRHIACLSFDFDAMSGHVAKGMTTPTPISQGEFGNVGAQRLLDLLAARQLPSSWFIPGVVVETYTETCRRIHGEGHEIGHHGWTHVPPAKLTREEEESGLNRGNEAIEKLTGRAARGYRSPSWDLSPHTIALLIDAGFRYDSSMMGHDNSPYYARVGDVVHADGPFEFGRATSLVEMPISWSLDDYPHFEFARSGDVLYPGLQNASGVLENWVGDFEYMVKHTEWGALTYTCHPYVIGRGHRLLMLERLIEKLEDLGAVFLTVEAVAEEYAARTPATA
jgi:peptidoglycan/xylan/chitin deacetylase (PgdA/CDA1 family)